MTPAINLPELVVGCVLLRERVEQLEKILSVKDRTIETQQEHIWLLEQTQNRQGMAAAELLAQVEKLREALRTKEVQ